MKKISNTVITIFFLIAFLGTIKIFDLNPFSISLKKEPVNYKPEKISQYSENEVKAIFYSEQSLEASDIDTLIDHWGRASTTDVKPDEKDYCRGAFELLTGERKRRIKAERKNENQQKVIFLLTVLIGLILCVLKSKKMIGRYISDDNREAIINIVEFGFAIAILGRTIF